MLESISALIVLVVSQYEELRGIKAFLWLCSGKIGMHSASFPPTCSYSVSSLANYSTPRVPVNILCMLHFMFWHPNMKILFFIKVESEPLVVTAPQRPSKQLN